MEEGSKASALAIMTAVGLMVLLMAYGFGSASSVPGHATNEAQAEHAIEIDLAKLRADPAKYSGKRVRLIGKLDECYGWECSLCPEAMVTGNADAKQCLPLEFKALMPGTGFGGDAKEAVFRFSTVTLEATFDPSCWATPCLDRQTALSDADVVSVRTRRSSREGLWLSPLTQLQEAPAALAITLRAEALKAGFPPEPPMKVFTVDGDLRTVIVCWAPVGITSWPRTLEGAVYAKSINDDYSCNKARLMADHWVMQVQG